jgi:hypothetical protein
MSTQKDKIGKLFMEGSPFCLLGLEHLSESFSVTFRGVCIVVIVEVDVETAKDETYPFFDKVGVHAFSSNRILAIIA